MNDYDKTGRYLVKRAPEVGWVPLMRDGGEPAIIAAWWQAAEQQLQEERERTEVGSLALVFFDAGWPSGRVGERIERVEDEDVTIFG